MNDQWFYVRNRQKIGPVPRARLKQLVARGEIKPTDLVIQHGMQKWVPASSVNGLFPQPQAQPAALLPIPASPATSATTSTPEPASSQRRSEILRMLKERWILVASGAGALAALLAIAVVGIAVVVNSRGNPNQQASSEAPGSTRSTVKEPNDAKADGQKPHAQVAKADLPKKAEAESTTPVSHLPPLQPGTSSNPGVSNGSIGPAEKPIQTRPDNKTASQPVAKPNDSKEWLDRGNGYVRNKEYDKAIAEYTEAIRRNPRLAIAYVHRARAYQAKGDIKQALSDYDMAIKLDSESFLAYYRRGFAHNGIQQFDKAIQDFNKAIELKQESYQSYYGRGNAHQGKGDYAKAIADYTKAIQIQPNFIDPYRNRAVAYEKQGQIAEAAADREQLRRLGDTPIADAGGEQQKRKRVRKEVNPTATPDLTERKPESEPKPVSPTTHDPVVAHVLAVTSPAYSSNGFKDYTFGTSREKINRKTPLSSQPDSIFLGNKEREGFLFVGGKLVGLWKIYEGDTEGNLLKVLDLFGKPPKENMFDYSGRNESGGNVRESFAGKPYVEPRTVRRISELRTFHVCPKAVACIRITQDASASTDGRRRNSEEIGVGVLDREWAMATLDHDLQSKRAAYEWLKKAVDPITKTGKVTPGKLPAFPGSRLEKGLPNDQLGKQLKDHIVRAAFVSTDGTGDGKAAKKVDPFLIFEQLLQDLGDDRKGTINIVLTPANMPGYKQSPLWLTPFDQLVLRCNSALAQEFFPPKDATITAVTKPNRHVTGYKWQTKDGWKVFIVDNNSIQLMRIPSDL